jgi:TIR domain
MGLLAGFRHDLFVSYAHLDDQPPFNDLARWVTNLVRFLEIQVNQDFRSQKVDFAGIHAESAALQDSARFDDLKRSALFLVVMSEAYLRSEWCRKELNERLQASYKPIDIFMILPSRIDRNFLPEPLQDLLGYVFWLVKKGSEILLGYPEPDPKQTEYWRRLALLSSHIVDALKNARRGQIPEPLNDTPYAERLSTEEPVRRSKIFVSYSHKDRRLFEEFKIMLAPVVRTGRISVWNDTQIAPGAEWLEDIRNALRATKVALLLVSPYFLASEFITNLELPSLLQAAKEQGVTIFWVCLSSCLYQHTDIVRYQAAHDIQRPLDRLNRPDRSAIISEICMKLLITADNVSAFDKKD